MKIVVTHTAPDLDAITSVWLLKKFLPGWEDAQVEFVPAGTHREGSSPERLIEPIEVLGKESILHVDTGLGPLDHHQTSDLSVCAASLTWEFVKVQSFGRAQDKNSEFRVRSTQRINDKMQAIERMVKVVVLYDHFQEVFFENSVGDYHEFSFYGIIEGIKLQKAGDDHAILGLGMTCLDALLHNFENRVWAEKEIAENGKEFTTKWGKGIAFETINDDVIKLSQKMGYMVVVRKDPRKGYVRIKARPTEKIESSKLKVENGKQQTEVDLTDVYNKLKALDPEATWFLHISKKMLLNGTAKNPKMIPSKLSLDDIIQVLKST